MSTLPAPSLSKRLFDTTTGGAWQAISDGFAAGHGGVVGGAVFDLEEGLQPHHGRATGVRCNGHPAVRTPQHTDPLVVLSTARFLEKKGWEILSSPVLFTAKGDRHPLRTLIKEVLGTSSERVNLLQMAPAETWDTFDWACFNLLCDIYSV